MARIVILCTMVLFGARGANLDAEREALDRLNEQFSKFQLAVDNADDLFDQMRQMVERHRYKDAGQIAEQLTPQIRAAARLWTRLDDLYYEYRLEGLDVHNQNLVPPDEQLAAYLSLKKNDRFGNGVPMDIAIRAWRGLATGTKVIFPPSSLRRTGQLEGQRLRPFDSVLVMTVHGGFIKGRIEGLDGKKLVLREILPVPLVRYQKSQGLFRVMPLDDIARIELIRRPTGLANYETPAPIVTGEGTYADYNVRFNRVIRIDIRPDDMELYQLVRDGRAAEANYSRRISAVTVDNTERPIYSAVFFLDCNELLKRVVKFRARDADDKSP
jgi:hypothetical protein